MTRDHRDEWQRECEQWRNEAGVDGPFDTLVAKVADMTRQRDEAVRERDEWKARRDLAVEECRFLHQEGMNRRDHHLKHCGAARAAQEAEAERDVLAERLRLRSAALDRVVAENERLRATVARVEALADEWERTLSVAQWRRQAARRLRAALDGDR